MINFFPFNSPQSEHVFLCQLCYGYFFTLFNQPSYTQLQVQWLDMADNFIVEKWEKLFLHGIC